MALHSPDPLERWSKYSFLFFFCLVFMVKILIFYLIFFIIYKTKKYRNIKILLFFLLLSITIMWVSLLKTEEMNWKWKRFKNGNEKNELKIKLISNWKWKLNLKIFEVQLACLQQDNWTSKIFLTWPGLNQTKPDQTGPELTKSNKTKPN